MYEENEDDTDTQSSNNDQDQDRDGAQPAPDDDRGKVIRSEEGLYSVANAKLDQTLELLTLARLPPWETIPGMAPVPTGHGWGYHLDALLGQGLARGELIGVAADRAGAGKTALVAQLVDGLITRSFLISSGQQTEESWGRLLSPVVLFSEMSPQQLAWRSGARWLGVDSQLFRGGATYRNRLKSDDARLVNDQSWQRLFHLLDPDLTAFGAARQLWLKRVTLRAALEAMDRNSEEFGDILVDAIRDWLNFLYGPHSERIPSDCVIRPILVIDPAQRSQQLDLTEVEALNRLARMLRTRAQSEGWVVLVTSDTNKASAIGTTKKETTAIEEAAAAFRGSYGLQHELSTALYIRRPPTARDLKPLEVEVIIPKSRWGWIPKGTPDDPWPRFEWRPQFLQFIPLDKDETTRRAWLDQEANEERKERRKSDKASKAAGPQEDASEETDPELGTDSYGTPS